MTKTINDFYQELDVFDSKGNTIKHQIFDYTKIWDDTDNGKNVLFYLIISERGRKAKSTQAKYLMKKIWDEEHIKSIWAMNTEKLIDKEKKSHLNKPKQFHKDLFHDNVKVIGDNVYDDPSDKENGWYAKFTQISTAENEKGSRDDYGLLLLDEFNVGDRNIKNIKTDLLSSLIATMDDPINTNNPNSIRLKKIIIHGNNKSLNDDFLINLGIYSIDKELTDLKIGDRVIGRILCPKMSESDKKLFEEQNNDNEIYLFQKLLGKADHVYYNENLFDEVNNVNHYMLALETISRYQFKIGNLYFEGRIINSKDLGTILYVIPITTKEIDKDKVFAMNKDSVKEGITLNTNIKKNLLKYLSADQIYFHSAFVREQFIKEIKK